MGLRDSEASFRKGYKKASLKTLKDVIRNDMGYSAGDFNFKNMDKVEAIEIIENHMGFDTKSEGGLAKSRTGTQDYRKGGMVISTVDNRRNKG